MSYKKIDIAQVKENAVTLFSENWALLTAGDRVAHNSMTVSWGLMGELWGKHVAVAFVRPQRYTREFADRNDCFSLSFYGGEDCKKELGVFGGKSGRDIDKYKETGISPLFEEEWVYTDKSNIVLLCKKIAVQGFDPAGFLIPEIAECYPNNDHHIIYVGEIVSTLERE